MHNDLPTNPQLAAGKSNEFFHDCCDRVTSSSTMILVRCGSVSFSRERRTYVFKNNDRLEKRQIYVECCKEKLAVLRRLFQKSR